MRTFIAVCIFALACAASLWGATAPVLTSVTPNPLNVGTIQVTLKGKGFQAGAMVYDQYGKMPLIQTTPDSVSKDMIKVTIYQGPATSTTFSVKNPGSNYSNIITVPVNSSSTSGGGSSGNTTTVQPPVLTSVSPNPLPSGTVKVTLTGTGFLSGAMGYQTYTGQTRIQYGAESLTSNSITFTVYTPPSATTVTFEARNVGNSAYSNAITVPVSGSSSGGGGSSGGGSTNYTLTVVNGKIQNSGSTGSFAAGTQVSIVANTPPAGQAFQSWTGAQVASVMSPSTTLNMPAANTTVTANFYTPTPVPNPVSTHPRLWLTQQDLPRLQSWATSNNPVYQAMQQTLATAQANYNQAFPPGATQSLTKPIPANPYPDFGDTQGYTGLITEENAVILAFNSLIDPSQSNRIKYAQEARNLVMYAMNQAALGVAANQPFRDPAFPIYNRASAGGHEWPLVVDWIYSATDGQGNPILTSADKLTIRNVFMQWAQACLNASTTGGDNPGTPGLVNSLALLPGNKPYRMASNNYYLAHARNLTLMALALDPADDPAVNASLPAAQIGNSLRSYVTDATGAWLYEEYAMMGDPQAVAQSYGVPNNPTGAGFGLASGGLPPEGMLYGESFGYILGQLLALHTAGFDDPQYSGPQIALTSAPVWDRYVQGYISSLTPTAKTPASEPWLGPVYQFAGYGDMLRLWVTPDQVSSFSLLGLLDQERGVSTHVNAARWFVVNAMPGGQAALTQRVSNPWTWGVTQDILYYMLLDPTAAAPTDPRPGFPMLFYDAPAGRIIAKSDWSANGTMFDYRSSWISINHQDGASGQFGLFRKGEWLTKEMSNYDNTNGGNGTTTTYHNTLSLQNDCANCATIQWQSVDLPAWQNGSQWMLGEDAGDPVNTMSSGPGYVYANSDLTKLYNRPNIWTPGNSVMAITQATRSIVWLNNDYIVVYDRATSTHSGLWKKFNLSLVSAPQVNGNTATDTLPSGQQLFIQTLLPLNPTLSSFNGAAGMNPIADLEPTKFIYQVQDASMPADTRFLHVIEGADAGTAMAKATYLQSIGGNSFDGAAFASSAVYFPVNVGAFTGTTLTVPAGVHQLLVTGLAPNTGYAVQVSNGSINITPNGSSISDGGGVLVLSL